MVDRPVEIGFLSPLNNTNAVAIEIVIKTQIKNLGGIIQAIEIKMIERWANTCRSSRFARTSLARILFEQGKGWTIDIRRNIQPQGQTLCKRRFAGAELTL